MKNIINYMLICTFLGAILVGCTPEEKGYDLKEVSLNVAAPDSVVKAFGFLVGNSLAAQQLRKVSLEAIEKGFKAAFDNGDPNDEDLRAVNQKIGMYLQTRG